MKYQLGSVTIEAIDTADDVCKAAIKFLSQLPGWDCTSGDCLGRHWMEMEAKVGPEETERIWSAVLDEAIRDRLDDQRWRNWVGIFVRRIFKRLSVAECAGGAEGVMSAGREPAGGRRMPGSGLYRQDRRRVHLRASVGVRRCKWGRVSRESLLHQLEMQSLQWYLSKFQSRRVS